MEKLVEQVAKFIKDNNIDLSGEGSELNGNCVIVAGFICYIVNENDEDYLTGAEIIAKLGLNNTAHIELERVYDFAYYNTYENFWYDPEAKEQYVF